MSDSLSQALSVQSSHMKSGACSECTLIPVLLQEWKASFQRSFYSSGCEYSGVDNLTGRFCGDSCYGLALNPE